MAFQGIDVRGTGDRLLFRVLLLDSAGAFVTAGTTNLKLYELQSDGTVKSYDFNDNTFKTTALTTENQTMTHQTGNNGATSTGVWSFALTTVSGFTVGSIYFASVNNSGASPPNQSREFQYGNAEGDMTVTSARLNVNVEAINADAVVDSRLAAALTTAVGIDLNMGQATPGAPTVDTTGEALKNAHDSLPLAIAAGASGGLPTVDASNRIAGIVGTRYNTLDQIGTSRLINTTATASSTTTQIFLTAVLGTDANDDFNGNLLIIYDVSDGNRPSLHIVSDYTAASNICDISPACRFTPVSGDLVEIWSVGDSTVLSEILKLTAGFGAANPDNLNSYLKAMMSKTAAVPAGLGTYSPTTDALEVLRERLDLIEGAGFATATDSLAAIRDAIDTLVAPSIVVGAGTSGSGFIADVVSMIRRAVDEPSTTPKYTNTDIIEFMSAAYDVIMADIQINTDHPIMVRANLSITSGKQAYTLPPHCAQVVRVAHINTATGLPDWELWPGSELSGHGQGFSVEGNTLRLLSDWKQTETIEVLFIPNSETFIHKGTITAATVGANVTSTTITLVTTPDAGTLDTRANSYAGYVVRILSSDTGRSEERIIKSYNNVTRVATITEAWDTTPSTGANLVYEVVPQFSRLIKHVVILRSALDILAQEGNQKRMQTLMASYQVKLSAIRRYLSSKVGRFLHSPSGDTMDNSNRGSWGYGGLF
jgi:hypothetical protein